MAPSFKKNPGFWQGTHLTYPFCYFDHILFLRAVLLVRSGVVGFYAFTLFVALPLGIKLNNSRRARENPRPPPNDDIANEVYKMRLEARKLTPKKSEN